MRELEAREPLFHRPELGTDFAAMTTADFWEVGASGRRYTRDEVLAALADRHSRPHADPWQVTDFASRRLGADAYLVTYTLAQDDRLTRRATLWQHAAGEWRAIYHQGTVVS